MKKCTICKVDKKFIDFNKNKSRKDGLNTICRGCSKERSRRYYKENREHHKEVVRNRSKKLIKENQIKMLKYFKTHPCIDCGNTNPIVLEFDHKDGVNKFKSVGVMINDGYSWTRINDEVKKCDVRCANCHRIRTAKQFNWYDGLL